MGYTTEQRSSGAVLPVLPPELIKGIRDVLECGMDPQELGNRLGGMIDVMVEDIQKSKKDKHRRKKQNAKKNNFFSSCGGSNKSNPPSAKAKKIISNLLL